jgi:pimeloyl-ACP methyl ester carboxylesterase
LAAAIAFVMCCISSCILSNAGFARSGDAHLYVLLGFAGLSPGLSDFGDSIGHRDVPTSVGGYGEWPASAEEAIRDYKAGRLSSVMIIGHSLGGSAARAMAAELGQAHVPVGLVVTLDPVGEHDTPRNVRRSVTIRPGAGEDHFAIIEAHRGELNGYVLGKRSPRRMHARTQALPVEDRMTVY